MPKFGGLPMEGQLTCEYSPRPIGPMLTRWSAFVGFAGFGIIVIERLRHGTWPDPWVFGISLGGMLAFLCGIGAAIHFSGRGIRVVVDFDEQLISVTKLRRDGETTRERTYDFDDVLDVTMIRNQMENAWIEVYTHCDRLTIHDSLSKFETLYFVLTQIAQRTDSLPMHRRTWFRISVLTVVMFGAAIGACVLAISMGWI